MQVLELKPKEINPAALRLHAPKPEHYPRIITGDCTITVDGVPKIVQRVIDIDNKFRSLRAALRTIDYPRHFRTDGLPSFSRVFGWLPRNTIRRDYCGPSSLAKDYPVAHQLVCEYADIFAPLYQQAAPETFAHHSAITAEKVKPVWKLGNSPFTSGIINSNNELKYHFDSGNFPGVWSCMLVLKRGVEGGHLAIPQFEIAMEVPDCSLIFFDGQSILHSVTPFVRRSPRDYRISIVYYSLQALWHCMSPKEEGDRIRGVSGKRAVKRAHLARTLRLDQRAPVKHPIFIASKGRSLRCKSPYIVRMNELPFTLVVHADEADEYRKFHVTAEILVLPAAVRGLGAVRQFILEHCRALGVPYYWLIDDNVSAFYYAQDGEVHDATVRAALGGIEQIAETFDNLSIVSCVFSAELKASLKVEENLKLLWNQAAQCCVLVSTATGTDYNPELEFKSDIDFCIKTLQAGTHTLRVLNYGMQKPMLGSATIGGLKDKFVAGQHEEESRKVAAMYPEIVKTTQTKRGLDVVVDWEALGRPLAEDIDETA